MKKSTILIVAVAVMGLCCLGAVGVAVIGGLASTETVTQRSNPDISPTPIPPAPAFAEIRANHEAMTEAQWKQYRTTVEGTLVIQWRGWVDEVTGQPGRYVVRIDMDGPDEFLSVSEVNFGAPDDLALSLQMDQPLTFSGQIKTAQDFIGSLDIELEHVTIH